MRAGRITRRGLECAVPPSLTWVLGAQVPHLLVMRVRQFCSSEGPAQAPNGSISDTACLLEVNWYRAGTGDREGLPPSWGAVLGSGVGTAEVIELLTHPPDDSNVTGSFHAPVDAAGVRMRVSGHEANPGYRLRPALMDLELQECQAERGASRLQLAWTVTPTGAVESVTATGADDAVNACVKEKLEQLTLTCTPTGEPIPMQTTLCLAN